MIDVVFLLIIFFLVSSHLSRQENRQPVTLAQADGGRADELDTTPLTLTLDSAGKFFFASDPIPAARLGDRLIAYRQARARTSGGSDIKVRLRIDRVVPYRDVEPILKTLAKQGIADVSLVVSPRDTAPTQGNAS